MKKCLVCEGTLPESSFRNDASVCSVCMERLRRGREVEYGLPRRRTWKQAVTDLIVAVRSRAVEDDEAGGGGRFLGDFNRYWVESEPWASIWRTLKDVEQESAGVRGDRRLAGRERE